MRIVKGIGKYISPFVEKKISHEVGCTNSLSPPKGDSIGIWVKLTFFKDYFPYLETSGLADGVDVEADGVSVALPGHAALVRVATALAVAVILTVDAGGARRVDGVAVPEELAEVAVGVPGEELADVGRGRLGCER